MGVLVLAPSLLLSGYFYVKFRPRRAPKNHLCFTDEEMGQEGNITYSRRVGCQTYSMMRILTRLVVICRERRGWLMWAWFRSYKLLPRQYSYIPLVVFHFVGFTPSFSSHKINDTILVLCRCECNCRYLFQQLQIYLNITHFI